MNESLSILPSVNATLNGLAAICLFSGWRAIKAGRRTLHRNLMVTALCLSAVFLACYLIYHYQVGSVRFQGQGTVRWVYFTILITHTILAAAVPFLAGITVWHAFRSRFDRHVVWARRTFPIWLYVSVTGVVIYAMLYHLPV